MIEAQHWHPVTASGAVQTQPVAAVLLGQPLVIWRDGEGQVRAFADQCPHRGARLSLGNVINGRLQCGYHGWQFAAQGRCVLVPALPDFVPPASHCAKTFMACERYGLVWVRLVNEVAVAPTPQELPVFEAEQSDRLRKLLCGPYDVATSAPRIVENFLDMAHFGFVHEGILGTLQVTAIDDYAVAATPTGLLATQCKAWQPRASAAASGPVQVHYTYEVTAPYAAVLTKQAVGEEAVGVDDAIALFICPQTPVQSRVWFRLAVADFESTDAQLQAFQDTIFLQDKPVLESQSPPCLPLDVRCELHTAADKASAVYRRYLKNQGITFGVC
jgi:phenylpropionate dioxygenase-like ring-hydroxylating dioxygenase large terminal subunit